MQRRFRQVFSALREQSRVSYAKIATIGGFCDIDMIIIKATASDDMPLPERYIHELLKIFSLSPTSVRAFLLSFTRRFGKTHCWRVALKCLLLLHRLLRSLPEDSPFRSEFLWTKSSGLMSLNPCHFQDESSSSPEDFTIFIRSYAYMLDEALNSFASNVKATHDEEQTTINTPDKMKQMGKKLEVFHQLQSLIDKVMECRPIGCAAKSFIVKSAMKHIIRDSFVCYTTFRREVVLVLDNLFQMPYRSCISAFGIYKKSALQANQLCEFYDWCKAMGFCGIYEYPFVDRIPLIQIQALETFVDGMWQLTGSSSSSTTSPLSSTIDSRSSLTAEDHEKEKQSAAKEVVLRTQWELFDEEEQPLIRSDEGENENWEALLEASIDLSHIPQNTMGFYPNSGFNHNYQHGSPNGYGYDGNKGNEENGGWKIEPYNSGTLNPFY